MPKTKIINVKNYLVDCTHKLKAASKFYIERNKLAKEANEYACDGKEKSREKMLP